MTTNDDRGLPGRVAYLVASQILGGIGVASGIVVGGLLAKNVSGSTSTAGLAQTASVLGGALIAVPLATLAERHGRSLALSTGYLVAMVGAVAVITAAALNSLALLLFAMVLFGAGSAVGLQARYAAIDGVGADHRARTLSIVVWATTIGAVLGPNLAEPGGTLGQAAGLPKLAGPFMFSMLAFTLAVIVVLRLPGGRVPLGQLGDPSSITARPRGNVWSALGEAIRRPTALTGLVALAAAHATMVAVMVMTPVNMGHEGASLRLIGLVISLHIVGMYAFSPVMGWLADRIGERTTIMFGVLTLLAALLGAAGARRGAHTLVAVALFLLGLGWSACVVAGSSLLSGSVPATIRTQVQGGGDLIMGLSAAAAGAVAGPILAATSYHALSLFALTLLVPIALMVVWSSATERANTR